ncbi:hypothetical protein J4E70_05960 [Pseudohalocynthiibacter aestuariivivens]|uniref:hypothetical protein n=1 Tax=Pseudohalocynthiibacter aestuariivivens TaxID=1591409 RepID=UPI001BD5A8BB|nr:hypothetical protein [Pseudohalocynthiibacter aestuariivivens]MBS9716484.1 hypothetical protein [Pseudohalocynthiibacter aestuariivivens]
MKQLFLTSQLQNNAAKFDLLQKCCAVPARWAKHKDNGSDRQMGLEKYANKIDEYFARLEDGKAKKIKPSHVLKVISKLQKKEQGLVQEIEATEKDSKKDRLKRKVLIAREHIKRAELLLDKITPPVK